MGLIDSVAVNVGGNGSIINTLSTYITKVLKPNIINGKNVLTQEMMPGETGKNTKYVIKYDYDLNEESVSIPNGCLIEFDGGSISNGTIVGNQTIVIGHQKISEIMDVTVSGTFVFDINMITLAAVAFSGNYSDLNGKPVGAGDTRPDDVEVGYMFFDTNLGENGKPIWRVADGWVDALGNSVDTAYQLLIDVSNKLSADLISDGNTNIVVTTTDKNTWDDKQDAITGTSGNFAGFDSNGKLSDSGSKPSDFEPAQS